MLDDDTTSTNDPTTPDAEAPVRRTRRRAASRPAGPPQPDPSESAEAAGTTAATTPPAPTEAPAADEAPVKPAKKTAARKTSARKRATRATPAPQAVASEATGVLPAVLDSPAGETPSEETPVDEIPVEETPIVETPVDEIPVEEIPAEETAAEETAFVEPLVEEPRPRRRRTSKKAAAEPAAAPFSSTPPESEPEPQPAVAELAASAASPFSAPVATAAPEPTAPAKDAKDAKDAGALPPVVLFQAPDPVEAPARRRSTRTAGAPDTAPAVSDSGAATPDALVPSTAVGADDVAETPTDTPSDDEAGSNRRRRSRGGRNRRKQGGDSETDTEAEAGETATTAANASSATADGESTGPGEIVDEPIDTDETGSSSRRRRRRRRPGDDADSGGDPDNTVVRVRTPRAKKESITSVEGSTRIEAKKQRRREGREAGRRRPPILSESEFLARRESVERVMAIRQRGEITQIAVLEDNILVEHYVALESENSLIGNVYVGRVQNVLPSMEAAFVDIGKGRNAVLYAGEVNWSLMGGGPRRIENALKPGQAVLVQVSKDPVGHKGARLTSMVSLPGRYLVYVPGGGTSGISRKLPDTERARLKALLKQSVPDSAGVIVRTAAEGASEEELTRDVNRLTARWDDIDAKSKNGQAPQLLYAEPDTTLRVVRDLFTEDFARLVISGDDAWDMVDGYVQHVAPDLAERLERYDGGGDVFAEFRVDEQIAKALERKVWLPSGGSLVIDRTEAMTVVDVNTGKFTGSGGNLEETVTKNNLEAAEEIVRQLRLRDIGGIIVVDFIDMVLESNRDLVLRRLVECLGRDRTRHQVAEVTSLGLVQMTRKRISTGLLEAFSHNCEACQGRGVVIDQDSIEAKKPDSGPQRGSGPRPEPSPRPDDAGRTSSSRSGGRRRGRKGADDSARDAEATAVPTPTLMASPPGLSVTSDEPQAPSEPLEVFGTEVSAPEEVLLPPVAPEPDAVADEVPSEVVPSEGVPATEVAEVPATEVATQPVVAEEQTPAVTAPRSRRRRSATRPAGQPSPVSPSPLSDAAATIPGEPAEA